MSYEMRDGRYLSQIYFACADGMGLDILGFLYRDRGEPFHLVFRFRYYASADPWDKRDVKNWHEAVFSDDDEEKAARTASQCFRMMTEAMGEPGKPLELHVVPVRSTDPKVMHQRLAEQPWTHIRVEAPPADK